MSEASDRVVANTWFKEWFNLDYLELYEHRNGGEARSAAELLAAQIPDLEKGITLDLACGAGRHLPYLRRRQPTVGLDLSPWLLDVASRKSPGSVLVRADMRALPFADASFTLVASLFTSFGYFADDDQNFHVLREAARVTKPRGWLVMDFLNAPNTRRTLVSHDQKQGDSHQFDQDRNLSPSGRFVVKTIRTHGTERTFTERVRLFEAEDLTRMIENSGYVVRNTFGTYEGKPVTPLSPRVIVFAQRR